MVDVVLQARALNGTGAENGEVENFIVFQRQRQCFERFRFHTPRVKRRHQRAGTGTHHHIRVDAGCFEHLNHTHMREAARAARAEHQSDHGPLCFQRHDSRGARRIAAVVIGGRKRATGERDCE